MTSRAIIFFVIRITALLGLFWLAWSLVRLGLPLQWLAIFVGGSIAVAAGVSFLARPLFDRAVPDLEAKQRALLGYSVPRGVQNVIMIAYLIVGGAAAVWGLVTLPG